MRYQTIISDHVLTGKTGLTQEQLRFLGPKEARMHLKTKRKAFRVTRN